MFALPLIWRIGIVVAAVVAFAGAYTVWHHKVYQSGYDAAIAAVARADQDAINRVKGGIRDLVICRQQGGTWDVVSGTCK